MAEEYAQNDASKVDYTSTTAFPAFASKTAFMNELSDPNNTYDTDRLGFLARLANTDTDDWTSDSTADLGDITDWGSL